MAAVRAVRNLAQLLDCTIPVTPSIGSILTWQGLWTNTTPSEAGLSEVGHLHVSADISDATSAATASTIVKRDSAGKFSTVKISTSAGSGNGINIGTTNMYEQAGGFVRIGGSLAVDGTFNGSGAGLTAIPNTAITGLGTAALKNADNSANNTILLDGAGLLPTSCLPPLSLQTVQVVASQAAMLALTAQPGDVAVRSDSARTYMLRVADPTVLANWQELYTSGADNVSSVNSQTGNVILTTSNITEGSRLYYTDVRVQACALGGAQITSGTVAAARLGTGTTDSTTYLRGDGTWHAIDAILTSLTFSDTVNLVFNTTTGTKIGTATNQKFAFWNATPIIQPVNTTDLRVVLINTGLLASGGVSPLDLNGGLLTAGQITCAGAVRKGTSSVAYAATVTPNCDNYNNLEIGALTGNITIGAPTGTPVNGQELVICFTQDATGGRTFTWNAAFVWGTDIASTDVPTTASKSLYVGFKWHSGTSKWRAVSIVRGF